MIEFAYRKFDGPNGSFYRILERLSGGDWSRVAGSIDWDREEDAKRSVLRLAKERKGYIIEGGV